MVTKELVELIKKKRESGMSDEQIQAILENAGYGEEDIQPAIAASLKDDTSGLPTEAESHKMAAAAASSAPKKKKWWQF